MVSIQWRLGRAGQSPARPYVSGMSKVVIDMTMSLDGFIAGPHDGKDHPLGTHGGAHLFDWYFSGREESQPGVPPRARRQPRRGRAHVRRERRVHLRPPDVRDRRRLERPPARQRCTDVRADPQPTRQLPARPVEPDLRHRRHRERHPPGGRRRGRPGHQAGRRVPRQASAGCRPVRRDPGPRRAVPAGRRRPPVRPFPAGIRLEKLSVSDGPFATHMRYRVVDRPPR